MPRSTAAWPRAIGKVTIDAGRNVDIGARAKITADSRTGAAGSIAVNAGQDIKVAGYGTVSAKSIAGNAGTIVVLAQRNLTVEANSSFDVVGARQCRLHRTQRQGKAAIGVANINLSAPNGAGRRRC